MPVRTAAQRRRDAKVRYDAFLATCPSRLLMNTLADKWVMLVLTALAPRAMRHGELARHIAGVSQKMLTQTLRLLERDGLVTRTVTPTVPLRVDYALTPLGRDLQVQVAGLKRWAEAHMPEVLAARRAHDARTAAGAVARVG